MENKRIHIIIATTLSAILLWVSVNMSYEYQIAVAVPLVVENVPEGKAIASPIPRTIQVKFRGNGWRCAALLLGSSPRCVLDVATTSQNKRGLVLSDVVDRISIPAGILATDMKPESVYVGLDRYVEKRVPVVFSKNLEFRVGYGQIGDAIVSPDTITIGGAASLVPEISIWPTARVPFTDVKSTIDTKIPLADFASQYLNLSPPSVHVKVDVQQLAEKTIAGLPVDARSVPTNREVILIPPKISLVVRGGVQQLAALDIDSFHAYLNYAKIIADSTGYSGPQVETPNGVQLVSIKPERMQFIIRTKL